MVLDLSDSELGLLWMSLPHTVSHLRMVLQGLLFWWLLLLVALICVHQTFLPRLKFADSFSSRSSGSSTPFTSAKVSFIVHEGLPSVF